MTLAVLPRGKKYCTILLQQKGREESCEMDNPIPGQTICKLYKIENWQLFYGNFIRPKIKVGTEWVSEHYCKHYYQII